MNWKLCLFFQTRLSKILLVKKECIEKLRDMNTQAEKMVGDEYFSLLLHMQCSNSFLVFVTVQMQVWVAARSLIICSMTCSKLSQGFDNLFAFSGFGFVDETLKFVSAKFCKLYYDQSIYLSVSWYNWSFTAFSLMLRDEVISHLRWGFSFFAWFNKHR